MDISFKALQKSHFPLLLKWLESPHVKLWWDQNINWTLDLVEQKYSNYVQGFKRLVLCTSGCQNWLDSRKIGSRDNTIQQYSLFNISGLKKQESVPDYVIEKPIYAYIIAVEDKEIGYIQYYNAYDFPREQGYEIKGLPKNLASMDVFIGEEEWIDKGMGPIFIATFLKGYIFKDFDAVFVDPDTENVRAIKAYEKAGFRDIKTVKNKKLLG